MLALQPSLFYGAGFQLSFLASFAIIYVLSWVRGIQIKKPPAKMASFYGGQLNYGGAYYDASDSVSFCTVYPVGCGS